MRRLVDGRRPDLRTFVLVPLVSLLAVALTGLAIMEMQASSRELQRLVEQRSVAVRPLAPTSGLPSFEVSTADLELDGGQIMLLVPVDDLLAAERHRQLMLLAGGLLILGVVVLVGLLATQRISSLIGAIESTAQQMIEGNYEQRMTPSPIRELHALGQSVNRLAEQIEIQVSELVNQALYDSLTGLPNRSLFRDRLGHALARARRQSRRLAVLFLDVDNFKLVNDSLGHESGDQLLVMLAERLQDSVRSGDSVARLGGDEFTILLDGVQDATEATGIADRITEQLHAPLLLGEREIFASVSIGIALSQTDQGQPDELLRQADIALYQAKNAGKARWALFDHAMSTQAVERLAIETDLRHALERGELRVEYQPLVELISGRITDVEALVRWEHPRRGLIQPLEFIQIAEETGLIISIGYWVLEAACRQMQTWRERFPERQFALSVNLSVRQFQQPDLVDAVGEILARTGLEPSHLKLEVTESIILDDRHAGVGRLDQLRSLGIKVAIDDFGTGYSSLAQLKRLPVDVLKIDRSFIDKIADSKEDEAIVRSIISLANTLNLGTVGEGVETAEQLHLLRSLGCELAQGYYFAAPLSGEAIDALITVGWLPLAPASPLGRALEPAGAG